MPRDINNKRQKLLLIIFFELINLTIIGQIKNKIELINATYLGNYERNYYGNSAPKKLNLIWKHKLGFGLTNVSNSKKVIECNGAKRTCQPLLVKENDTLFIIQGGCNHFIKKIYAENGKLKWEYEYDDIINSTGTIWENSSKSESFSKYQIIQGSRIGLGKSLDAKKAESLRAISLENGKEIWRFNVKKTESISRDVDASCLIHNDSIFIGLENGILEILDPINEHLVKNGKFYNPVILDEIPLYNDSDVIFHQNNLIVESSPAKLGERIYIAAGSGHIFGYNLKFNKIDWDYYIGADIDGSTVITKDSCILIGFEKQYLEGYGGVLKINPYKKQNNLVEWFFPTENLALESWTGGVIGSVGINDQYCSSGDKKAAFISDNGFIYVVNHNQISSEVVKGPHLKKDYVKPELIFKKNIGRSVSTPIFVEDKLIAATSEGIWLYKINGNKVELLDYYKSNFDSTPVVHDNRIYIASTDGYLYCFGEQFDKY
tara:strand:- start:7913 stop:9382 length:1470 start_codon:yes stop_codon:yes gene_type:complete